MPLSKDDPALDYPGSWGDASKGWPKLTFGSEERASHAYYVAWRHAGVPYGSYVLVGKNLRLETPEFASAVNAALARHPYQRDWRAAL